MADRSWKVGSPGVARGGGIWLHDVALGNTTRSPSEMENNGSITLLLQNLPDPIAAQSLYERYLKKLIGLADRRLAGAPTQVEDGEDIAQSVLRDLFAGIELRRFPDLRDRNDLWQILLMLTQRRCQDHWRKYTSQHRGGGQVLNASDLAGSDASTANLIAEEAVDRGPSPDMANEFLDELRRRILQLPKTDLRQIAIRKMAGYTAEEIGQQFGISLRSVERKLAVIRYTWQGDYGVSEKQCRQADQRKAGFPGKDECRPPPYYPDCQ